MRKKREGRKRGGGEGGERQGRGEEEKRRGGRKEGWNREIRGWEREERRERWISGSGWYKFLYKISLKARRYHMPTH